MGGKSDVAKAIVVSGKVEMVKPKRREIVFRVGFTSRSARTLEELANAQGMFAPQYIRELCEAHILSKRQTIAAPDGEAFEDKLRAEMIALNGELMRIAGIRDDKKRMLDREVRKRMDGAVESEVWREKADGGFEAVSEWECEFDDDEDNPARKPVQTEEPDADEFDWSVPIHEKA
jgi:hypothetical protein